MATSFKKTKAKLGLLTDVNILFMAEKGIIGGIYHNIHWYIINIWTKNVLKIMTKIKNYYI